MIARLFTPLLLLSGVTTTALAEEACDLQRGAKLFTKCAVCHARDDSTRGGVGPNLHGIIGRSVASENGFPYSVAMEERGGEWTVEALDKFIASPMTDLPGTMMAFAGFRKEQDRRNIICYLKH